MDPVNAGVMVIGCGVRVDVIDILVFFHGNLHETVGHLHLCGFLIVGSRIEVPVFPVDSLLENKGNVGMGGLDCLNEGEEALFDLLRSRIREGVEDIGIHIRRGQGLGEIGLELRVAAAAETQELDSRVAGELGGIGHSCAGGAGSVGIAGSEDADPVLERIGKGFDHRPFDYSDFHGLDFAVKRKVEKAVLHAAVHVGNKAEGFRFLAFAPYLGVGVQPFAALFNIEVISPCRDSARVGRELHLSVDRLYPDGGGVRPEGDGNS